MNASGTAWCRASMCRACGRIVKHKPHGGPQRFHWCRLRWLSRMRERVRSAAWEEGYRFALNNVSDPMVYADLSDYGSGWAGAIKAGGIKITIPPEGRSS